MTHSDAQKLLGFPQNCTTQIRNVGNNCFRVNVYEKQASKEFVTVYSRLIKSAFIKLTEDGFKDITIHK